MKFVWSSPQKGTVRYCIEWRYD